MYMIRKLWQPEIFQGHYKRENYFEGWYFKNVNNGGKDCISIIPGISLTKSSNYNHCFIQVIDGIKGESWYIKYDIGEFFASNKRLEIRIGNSLFLKDRIFLDINDENLSLRGDLRFNKIMEYPKSLLTPGIMGWYSFLPFMECYHGVVSIDHEISGFLSLNSRGIDFNGGKGYIEKDWGRAFPSSWIWLQCNSFTHNEVSLMVSIAKIPWLNHSFVGFLAFLYYNKRLYCFNTYNGSKIEGIYHEAGNIKIKLNNKKSTLEILGCYKDGGDLKAPTINGMERMIKESINATIEIKLTEKGKGIIFSSFGTCGGLEICGNLQDLMPQKS